MKSTVEISLQVEELLRKITYNKFLYYFKNGEGCIDDVEYDLLVLQLRKFLASDTKLKERYGEFTNLPNFSSEIPLSKHGRKILSLDNLYSYDELARWYRYMSRQIGLSELEFYITPKIDGLFVNLIYRQGVLERVLTRYDGVNGEDITETVVSIDSIPKKLNDRLDIEIHGELYLKHRDYALILINSIRRIYDGLFLLLKHYFTIYRIQCLLLSSVNTVLEIEKLYHSSPIIDEVLLLAAKLNQKYIALSNRRALQHLRSLKSVGTMRNMTSGIARSNLFTKIHLLYRNIINVYNQLLHSALTPEELSFYLDELIKISGDLLKRMDGAAKYKRLLSFIPHGLGLSSRKIETLEEFHELIERNGFTKIPKGEKGTALKAIHNYIDGYDATSFDFESDGVVIALDNLFLQDSLGSTGNSPRGMRAYKIQPNARESTVRRVVFNIGRSGVLTPVAEIEPIKDYQGTTISRVTLHNYNFLKEKQIDTGDRLTIIRSGDVIPKLVKHTKCRERQREMVYIKTCYVCGTILFADDTYIICVNENCPGRLLSYLIYICHRKLLNIAIGVQGLKMLVSCNIVKGVRDFLEIEYDEIRYLSSSNGYFFSTRDKNKRLILSKSATKFLKSISTAVDKLTLKEAMLLLNIGEISFENAEKISERIGSLRELSSVDLLSIDGIGKETAKNVENWLTSSRHRELLTYLDRLVVKREESSKKKSTLCITGRLSMRRADFMAKYRDLFRFVDTVSKETEYLLLGEEEFVSKKLKLAKRHNTTIIRENEITKLSQETE
jgi:NAD-dependent DNA ligase